MDETTMNFRKGQAALMCQLCENDPKIKWKCLACDLMMCKRCRDKVHLKFPSAKDHTIIDIRDISKHQTEQKLDFTKLTCDAHERQICCLYCKTCEMLVCPTCISKTHKVHNLIETKEEFDNRLTEIKLGQKNLEQKIEMLTTGEEKLFKVKSEEQLTYSKVRMEIHDNEKDLLNAVTEQTNKLLSDLDQNWSKLSNSIEDEDRRVKDTLKTLLEQTDQTNDLLQTKDPQKMFFVYNTVIKLMNTIVRPVNITQNRIPKFVPIQEATLSSICGKLENTFMQRNESLQIVQELTSDIFHVTKIILCPDGFFWIYDSKGNILQNVKIQSNSLKIVSSIKVKISDMATTSSGNYLLICTDNSNLKIVSYVTEEVKDSIYNVAPLVPIAVHLNSDKKVVVGARDSGEYYQYSGTGPRQVIVIEQTGKQEKAFQYDDCNKPIFTYPCRITSNRKNDIAVVDTLFYTGRGRIVILDHDRCSINLYIGHPNVNSEDIPFKPTDIVATQLDNFVVTDPDNHTLHVLDSKGNPLTLHNTNDIGINFPLSLAISNTGQLYIGCGTATTNSKDKAKVYIIENFE